MDATTIDTTTIDTATLQVMYANAKTTYGQCGGHSKAARNEKLMDRYTAELTARGVNVATIPAGEFNGHGSS